MNTIELSNFKAVIYDMDGVLIDSEPLWKIAMEIAFQKIGCNLTKKDFEKTVGLRIDEVVTYWYSVAPWKKYSINEVVNLIINELILLIKKQGSTLPGVNESILFFKQKGLKIGLATSSFEILIETVLNTLNLSNFFDYTHSAEHEKFGKPHPDVYIHTATQLGVNPIECLVIEDSLNGVISGKAAKMHVVCIPEKTHEPNKKLILADFLFDDLNQMLQNIK